MCFVGMFVVLLFLFSRLGQSSYGNKRQKNTEVLSLSLPLSFSVAVSVCLSVCLSLSLLPSLSLVAADSVH